MKALLQQLGDHSLAFLSNVTDENIQFQLDAKPVTKALFLKNLLKKLNLYNLEKLSKVLN